MNGNLKATCIIRELFLTFHPEQHKNVYQNEIKKQDWKPD